MNTRRFLRPLTYVALLLGLSAASFGGLFVSVNIGPPPLPVYEQPACPGYGYMWTPGYWGWGDEGYYWVPGTWVQPPEAGLLWTPGYWGWNNGSYMWNDGYWGSEVGFYGGIDYGFGYTGRGYEGGYWRGHDFYYNRSVNNVNVTNVRNVYNKTVIVNNHSRVSYNGGQGGINMRETAQQHQWREQRHVEATPVQRQHIQEASHNRELLARNNNGRPTIAATARPNDFSQHVAARAAGGRIDRAALTATPKNMPARNNSAEGSRTAGRNEVPRPGNANRTETGSRATAPRTRETAPATARTERNVPKPPSASDRTNARTENADRGPKPSPTTSSRSSRNNTNARVNAPTTREANRPATAATRPETPARTTRPATAESRPASPDRSSRSMGMPQSERAPAPRAESHSAAPAQRPAERPAPQAAQHAAPPAQSHAAAPRAEANKPAKSEPPKDEKKH